MSKPKAIGLVVVQGGVAEPYAPEHVDLQVVDLDNLKDTGEKAYLPPGLGFEFLVDEAGISDQVTFNKNEKNEARRKSASEAVEAACRSRGDPVVIDEDSIRDLVSDLFHLGEYLSVNMDALVATSKADWEEERHGLS